MFNRPFDDQGQIRIRLESEAKLYIQDRIINKDLELVWSYILEFENSKNPHDERRNAIRKWKNIASIHIVENQNILLVASQLSEYGIKAKDALHVASALEAKVDYFLTTDDRLISGIKRSGVITVLTPIEYIEVLEK